LRAALTAALAASGKPLDRLAPDDLAGIDEFHVRGREATAELGAALGLGPGLRVLDVGCGIGGASRRLAAAHGCTIIGIDRTGEYCDAARFLADALGLQDRVAYGQASALALPFASGAFDAAYTQHVAMNIADKPALYREIARVLKPGAAFGLYDLLQGEGGDAIYPVPWAKTAATSFLVAPAALRRLIEEAGFTVTDWRDTTEQADAFFVRLRERARRAGPPPLGLNLLMGEDFRAMAANLARNLAERRVRAIQAVARRR
jgi:SAM-dependent methyltransferase